MSRHDLTLPEEALLLALRDEEGTLFSHQAGQVALAAAVFAELALGGRLGIVQDSGSGRTEDSTVEVTSADPIGHGPLAALFAGVVEQVTAFPKPMPALHWVGLLASRGDLLPTVAEQLCERGILRADVRRVALLFREKTWPELDPEPERELLARLRTAIFEEEAEVDPRTAALVALADKAGILQPLFGEALASRRARIERIARGELAGEASRLALDQMASAFWFLCVMGAGP